MSDQRERWPAWLTSLALGSDLCIMGDAAHVEATEAAICIRTPSLPRLRVGNALLFPRPPTIDDVAEWTLHLKLQVGDEAAKFGRIAWQGGAPSSRDVYEAFTQAGFEPYDSLSMSATASPAAKEPTGTSVSLVSSEADWGSLLQFHLKTNPITTTDDENFLQARLNLYRAQVQKGRAAWFTARIENQVIGCCGVATGEKIARLQGLEASTTHRRTGVGYQLVSTACRWALASTSARRIVAVVDPDYHARRLFEAAGFEPHDLACGLVPAAAYVPPAA